MDMTTWSGVVEIPSRKTKLVLSCIVRKPLPLTAPPFHTTTKWLLLPLRTLILRSTGKNSMKTLQHYTDACGVCRFCNGKKYELC